MASNIKEINANAIVFRKSLLKTIDKLVQEARKKAYSEIVEQIGLKSYEDYDISNGNNCADIKIIIDGYIVESFSIDQFNNVNLKFADNFPVLLLPKLALMVEYIYADIDCYRDLRAFTGVFVRYFQQFYKRLSVDEIVFMLNNGENFREWLIGDRYNRGGNISYFYFKDKSIKDEILKKLSK